jgi:hypothetical protein
LTLSPRKIRLSGTDRSILKILLAPNGKASLHVSASERSDKILATKLEIPLAEIKGRRRLLEKRFLELYYTMNLALLDHRRVDFLISTQRGLAGSIGKELLKMNESVYVGLSVGQPTIDVRAEMIVKDNGHLLDLMEHVKGMDGVRDVVWSEMVKLVGHKGSVPSEIVDVL